MIPKRFFSVSLTLSSLYFGWDRGEHDAFHHFMFTDATVTAPNAFAIIYRLTLRPSGVAWRTGAALAISCSVKAGISRHQQASAGISRRRKAHPVKASATCTAQHRLRDQ
jgi:hypothetical protein